MNERAEKLRRFWSELGAKLGIGFCLAGFVAIFLGWNGAASYDRVPAQFPWLISGGLTGLALVVIGAAMIIVDNQRRESAELQATLQELRAALEGAGSVATAGNGHVAPALLLSPEEGMVVAGTSSYHEPTCHLVRDRDEVTVLTPQEALGAGLSPCRICEPPGTYAEDETGPIDVYAPEETTGSGRRQLRAR